jgi:hypothetical protein
VLALRAGDRPIGRWRWGGEDAVARPDGPDRHDPLGGFVRLAPWRFSERDPTAAVLECAAGTTRDEARGLELPGAVRWRLTARLDDAALVLDLEAGNEGRAAVPLGLGLLPCVAAALLAGERAQVRVRLPGRGLRVLGSSRPRAPQLVEAPDVTVPPLGEHTAILCADLGEHPVVTLDSPRGALRVVLTPLAGIRSLLLVAPAEQPTVTLAVLSDAVLGAASPGRQAGAVAPLLPGTRRRLTLAVAVEQRR